MFMEFLKLGNFLKERLLLFFRNLPDRDVLSKSDPFCVLYQVVQTSNKPIHKEIARTEQIKNSLNPEWQKRFILDYYFEEKQHLVFGM